MPPSSDGGALALALALAAAPLLVGAVTLTFPERFQPNAALWGWSLLFSAGWVLGYLRVRSHFGGKKVEHPRSHDQDILNSLESAAEALEMPTPRLGIVQGGRREPGAMA